MINIGKGKKQGKQNKAQKMVSYETQRCREEANRKRCTCRQQTDKNRGKHTEIHVT